MESLVTSIFVQSCTSKSSCGMPGGALPCCETQGYFTECQWAVGIWLLKMTVLFSIYVAVAMLSELSLSNAQEDEDCQRDDEDSR